MSWPRSLAGVAALAVMVGLLIGTPGSAGAAPASVSAPSTNYAVINTVDVSNGPTGVAIDLDDDTVYVTNFYSNSLSVIDGRTGTLTSEIPLPINPTSFGGRAGGVAVNSIDDSVYIAVQDFDGSLNAVPGTVVVIRGSNLDDSQAQYDVGNGPDGVAIGGQDDTILVTLRQDDSIAFLNSAPLGLARFAETGDQPAGLAVDRSAGDDTVYVATQGSGAGGSSLQAFRLDTGQQIYSLPLVSGGLPTGVAVNERTNLVYVANQIPPTVYVVDGPLGAPLGSIAVGSSPYGVAVDQLDDTVFVSNSDGYVSVINGGLGVLDDTISVGVGSGPQGIAVSTSGVVYVANHFVNSVSVIGRVSPMIADDSGLPGSQVTLSLDVPQVSYDVDGATVAAVYFGDNQAPSVVPSAGDDWDVTVPPGSGSVPVTVELNGGLRASAGTFTYFPTVTFDPNGGSGAMAPQSSSTPAALTPNAFTRAGYTFDGWNTAADGSGTPYANGASYPFDADVTLYAQWSVTPPDGILGSFASLGAGLNSQVNALVFMDDTLFVGGNFSTESGGIALNGIASWAAGQGGDDTWASLGNGLKFGGSDEVLALATRDDTLVVGGVFNREVGGPGNAYRNIALWAPGGSGDDTWQALGSGLNNRVRAVAATDDTIYAGGDFLEDNDGTTLRYIASWGKDSAGDDTWSPLAAGLNGFVFALAPRDRNLYIGGTFASASSGLSMRSVGLWGPNVNGDDTWQALGGGFPTGVYTLGTSPSAVYAGGQFDSGGSGVGANQNGVAQWTRMASGDDTWSALLAGVNSIVRATAVDATRPLVYFGGQFTGPGRSGSADVLRRVVAWDAGINEWIPLRWGTALAENGVGGTVLAVASRGPHVYVGGQFTDAGGNTSADQIAKWTWDPPVGSNTVSSLPATLTGESFIGVPATGGVTFGGVPVTYTRDDSSTITVTAAPGAPSGAILIDGVGGWGSVGTYTASNPPSPSPGTPPSAPREVSAVAGDGSALVSWRVPESEGSFPVTDYQVSASPGGQSCVVKVPALSCTISGLSNGTSYTFEVRALNGAGWGSWSVASDPVTPVGPTPRPTIMITGYRGEGADAGRVFADGVTTRLAGQRLQARVHLQGEVLYYNGSTPAVGSDGSFRWQRKTNKTVYVYFQTMSGDFARSNRVIIRLR